jgi:hypothetical protein
MRITIFILLAAALLGASACSNARQEAAQQKAWDEMMVVHDEVMPRMSEINTLAKSIETSLADTTLSAELRAAAEQTLAELEAADKAMWDWMYDLQQLPDLRAKSPHEDILRYIEAETAEITEVKTAMLRSIEAGNAITGQLPSLPIEMPLK